MVSFGQGKEALFFLFLSWVFWGWKVPKGDGGDLKRLTPASLVVFKMLCASAWIPKGVSKTKFQEEAVEAVEAAEAVETGQASVAVPMDEEPDEDNEKVGIADVLADDLDGLKFHKSNRDDPYIKNKDEVYDEDELDDMTYR